MAVPDPSPRIPFTQIDRLLCFFSILVLLFGIIIFHRYSTDDAYISYRYAENLASGSGLVWNRGEMPVEGYTNFLWTVLLAGAAAVKLPLPSTGAFLSGLFAVLTVIITGVWAYRQREFNPHFPVYLPMLILSVSPPLALWATSGMETSFFTFLVVLACLVMSIENRGGRKGYFSGLAWGIAGLTRPDGLLLGYLLIIFSALEFGSAKGRYRIMVQRLVTAAIPMMIQIVVRFFFYQSLLPNTYYAKSGPFSVLAPFGIQYFSTFLLMGGGILFAMTVLSLFIRPRFDGVWTVLIACMVYSFYIISFGGDWMPGSRFFVPLLPLLSMVGAAFIVKMGDGWRPLRTILTSVVILHLAISGTLIINEQTDGIVVAQLKGEPLKVDVLKELGLHLRSVSEPFDTVAAIPAGKVVYYSRLPAIDMRGLCDRHISKKEFEEDTAYLPGHFKRDSEYVLGKKPKYIVTTGAVRKEPISARQLPRSGAVLDSLEILEHPEFQKCYTPVRVPIPEGDKDLLYYRRTCP